VQLFDIRDMPFRNHNTLAFVSGTDVIQRQAQWAAENRLCLDDDWVAEGTMHILKSIKAKWLE
jgi:hypothetical protein